MTLLPARIRSTRGQVALFLAMVSMASSRPATAATDFAQQAATDEQAYAALPIQLQGRIVDEQGLPVVGARVTLVAWGESVANSGITGLSITDGTFVLAGLTRRAVLARVEAPGHYVEILPVDLQRPSGESLVDMGDVVLHARGLGRARLIFAGDIMMTRRYFDRDEDGVLGEANDLLKLATLAADTEALFRFVRPVLESDDHTCVNLETAVTDNPATPHPTKDFVFYAYPESVDVLPVVGIESVTLGNNHVYDYLEGGFSDTLAAVTASGLGWFGAGTSDTSARQNRYYETLNGIDFALQGFGDMVGYDYGGDELHIIAKDTPIIKGGALHLNSGTITDFAREEAVFGFPIPVIHGGTEFAYLQKASVRTLFMSALDQGAGIVIAHHPHYAQGVGVYDSALGPRFILGSLGNFVFDQKIIETFHSYLAIVDVEDTAEGPRVVRLQLIPFWIDDYVPRLLVGEGLARMGRHIGHLSTQESTPGDGIRGATVFVQDGRLVVYDQAAEYVTTEELEFQNVSITGGQTGVIEFLPASPSDFLAEIRSDSAASCEVGRDLMMLGDFEEHDVDDAYGEGDRWEQNTVRFVQHSVAHRGRGAMVIIRKSSDDVRSSTWIDNKFTVEAGQRLTLTGFLKGDNTGTFEIAVSWMNGNSTSSTSTKYKRSAGTYGWTRVSVDLTVPSGIDGIKVYFRHYPPASGEGQVFLDDIALVAWDPVSLDATAGASLPTPNDWRYMRCDPQASISKLGLYMRHRLYQGW